MHNRRSDLYPHMLLGADVVRRLPRVFCLSRPILDFKLSGTFTKSS